MSKSCLLIERIKNLKIGLYRELIKINVDELTPNEIDLMYDLSRDRDIQEVLQSSLKREHSTMTPSLSKVP